MAIPISLREIIGEMDMQSDKLKSYLNINTGDLVTVPDELLESDEMDEDLSGSPDLELVKALRDGLEPDEYLQLPGRNEIHEYDIIERFSETYPDEKISEVLINMIHGSGAFRRFKDTLRRYDIEEEWFRFKEAALKEIAVEWLNDNKLKFVDDMTAPGETAESPQEIERREVVQVIHDAIGWALNKDFDRLYAIMAQDDAFFIFHPDSHSTIVGFAAFKRMAEKLFRGDAFKATDYAVHDLRLNFSRRGDTAWYACTLDDHSLWNGKPGGWDNCRWTGTLEKRDGNWVIVQMHFSFAKDD